MTHTGTSKDISIIVTLFNEVESLPELHEQLVAVLSRISKNYEVLYIDDGSKDGSFEVLRDLSASDSNVRVISLRRNHGKSAALAVGFREAVGSIVITMDADLQDSPAEIPALIEKLDEGFDLVSGWKKKRFDPLSKTLPSKIYNYITSVVSGIRLHDFNCGLKAYRNSVVKDLFVYGELHRFLPVLAHKMGYRIAEIPVVHQARKYGVSKFGMSRFLNGFLDLLTVLFLSGFNRAPSHLFGTLGLLSMLSGLLVNFYLTLEWLQGVPLSNRPLLFLGILLMVVGVQFFSFGLLSEMLVNHAERDRDYPVKFDSRDGGA